jgi:glycosyltransferase involved in cell wall biosynthesis
MRVALACDWFLKYTAAQAAGLASAGADVLLLCRDHPFEFGGDAAERADTLGRARDAGVEVLEAPGRLWDPAAVPLLLRIRRRIARFRAQVVHVQDRVDPRAIALLPLRAPAVLTVHDPVLHPGQPVARLAPKRWLLEGSRSAWRRRARVIVVHSERLRAEVALRAGQRCVVIPHGLDALGEPLPPPPDPLVGFFGRLEPYKGLDILARAMPLVWDARPDVQLGVAGTGSTELPLEDPRVRLERAYLPETEVEAFFRRTSLAVLPYTQASQTGAGSVAVGYGVPIVASRLGGLPDLVLDDSYLVDAGDEAGLAAAIVRHIDDDAAVRSRVLAEVAAPRSWDAVARAGLELYAELLASR